jgi:hypothetical protein
MTENADFRPDVPSPARIYDYLLGGKDNYPADREAAEQIAAKLPRVRDAFQLNRAFLQRAVRFLVREAGIRQILDIGTGLPTVGNVHEVARAVSAGTRVVYVDNDPVVLAHGRDLLHGEPDTVILRHDLRRPAEILVDQALRKLIDFTEPVGLLLVAVLHFISDKDDPAGIIRQLLAPFPAGSYVVISHGTPDAVPAVNDAAEVYENATEQAYVRTRDQVLALVRGLDLVGPGITWMPEWRPEPDTVMPDDPSQYYYYALLARKPEPRVGAAPEAP